MAEETQYIANTGIAKITTGTSSMTGTGSTLILTAGAFNGTLLKTVTIKSITTNAAHGIVRLFVNDGGANYALLTEVDVPPITKAAINKAYETKIDLNFSLKAGYKLYASTSIDNSFNIIAEGLDWTYYATSVREDTTQYAANTGFNADATANSNLDGITGFYALVYTAGASATYKGSSIETITIKATVSNTPGMVRLYIYDGTTKFLFTEVVIPSITKTATDKACDYTIVLDDNLDIKAGYAIYVSTEKAENFNILVEGKDWNYAA